MEGWSVVGTFGDLISAEALVGLLETEQLPCHLASNAAVPGLGSEFAVLVPNEFLPKAQRTIDQAHVSEQELTSLAMSAPPAESEEP